MQYRIFALSLALIGLVGCNRVLPGQTATQSTVDPLARFESQVDNIGDNLELQDEIKSLFTTATITASSYHYPMEGYLTHKSKKVFGQYIASDSGDRFSGYHTGDDIEVDDITVTMPVYAATDATVVSRQTVSGYGGVLIIEFTEGGVVYHALYGHLDLDSVTVSVGDTVTVGQQLGVLGEDVSTDTDGERKHLHFGIYPYSGSEFYAGYVNSDVDLTNWINPSDFLRTHSAVE